MGIMDKVKNLFTEEVEEPKPIKKEVRHVEIPSPKKEAEPIKEENTISDSSAIKKEEKFVFPVYFDDKDFDDLEKPKELKKEKNEKKEKIEISKPAYQGTLRNEIRVEENKKFKPSLIISPVYGVLNKNYHKDDIVDRPERFETNYYTKSENMTVDDIRNKAYGTLEDELKNNILGNEDLLIEKRENTETAIDLFNELDFDELDKKNEMSNFNEKEHNNDSLLDNNDLDDDTAYLAHQLEEQKKKLNEINDYISENTVEKSSQTEEENVETLNQDNLNTELDNKPVEEDNIENVSTEKIEEQEETKKENESDLTESELFNLIDSMYDDKEEE